MDKRKQIIERLEGKTRAEIIAEEYSNLGNEIFDALGELKNFGGECSCEDDFNFVKLIHTGSHDDTDEIYTYCLKCGGLVANDWGY